MNKENYLNDLEKLRKILISKGIISKDESIGIKQFFKYSNFLKYGNNSEA